MISALKRLVATDNNNSSGISNNSNGQATNNIVSPNKALTQAHLTTTSLINNGMQMISQSLQKKFSKGVNYNMKIVIRGDCNTGKTCLWLRLQGQQFREIYESSDEIKVANIQWNYKSTDDVVKVEIWDVVDRSKKKRNLLQQQKITNSNSLKLENSNENLNSKIPVEASLDAEFIDVYKNANGCILIYDITKQWTWDYIERELPKIPSHIPVLIIGNHRDMHHHRCVDELKCKFFIESLNRGSLASAVRYTEASMRTGYGLTYLYKFFNIPFLQLQRENLMQQLEINAKETDAICEELQNLEENINEDYENFSHSLNSKRRQQQEENAKEVLKNAKTVEEARKSAQEKEAQAQAAQAAAQAQLSEPKKVINNIINKINTNLIQPNAPAQVSMSVTIDPNSKIKNLPISNSNSSNQLSKNQMNLNIEDVKHDDELNRFLEEQGGNEDKKNCLNVNYEDEEDEDQIPNNPMVAAFKENIDSSDEDNLKIQKPKINLKKVELSDEEDEDNKIKNISSMTSNLTIKNPKQQQQQQNEFVFVNNNNKVMSSHNSSSSNISSNTSQIQQQTSLTQNKNQTVLDSISTTTSISLVNYDTTSQTSTSLPVLDDQSNIKLTTDDFEFLEKMSQASEKTKPKSKSSKSSKNNDLDQDSSKTKTKKKKSKSSKESNDENLELNGEKKEKKKSKKSSKSSKAKPINDFDNESEDLLEENNIHIKRDVDYEEL